MDSYTKFSSGLDYRTCGKALMLLENTEITEVRFSRRSGLGYDASFKRWEIPYALTLPILDDFYFLSGGGRTQIDRLVQGLMTRENSPYDVRVLRSLSDPKVFGVFVDASELPPVPDSLPEYFNLDQKVRYDKIGKDGLDGLIKWNVSVAIFEKSREDSYAYRGKYARFFDSEYGTDHCLVDMTFLGVENDKDKVAEMIRAEFLVPGECRENSAHYLNTRLMPNTIKLIRSEDSVWGVFRDNTAMQAWIKEMGGIKDTHRI